MRATGPGQSALLILDVVDVLNKSHIKYAIIGAFAASFYGVVRASLDADAVISSHAEEGNLDSLLNVLKRMGLESTYRKGEPNDPIGAVINIEDEHQNRVDLLMDIRGMSNEIYSRTVEAEFMDAPIRLVGIEDFIAMKLFAGSPKDLSDASGVLRVSRERIDYELLKAAVQKYGKDAEIQLQSLLKESAPNS